MIKAESKSAVNCSAEKAFQYVAAGFFENHRSWEPAVVTLERTSSGPVGVGTTARQVRKDGGRETESTFEITRYDPNRAFTVTSTSQPYFQARYTFEPLMAGGVKKGSRSIVDNLKRLLEAEGQAG